jgi:FkbM family methyltransferase
VTDIAPLRLHRESGLDGVWRPLDLSTRPADALGPSAPLAHRLAHETVARGFRGRTFFWRSAERLAGAPQRGELVLSSEFSVPLDCSDVGERRLYEGGYHAAERSLVTALVGLGGTVLDVGANIGLFTFLAAALVGENGRVHAFEPNPPTFDRLRTAAGAARQVTLHAIALSDEPGVGTLDLQPDHFGATALRTDDSGDASVVVSTVDSIAEREGLGDVDLMKIDVEGEEERVLRGADALVRGGRVAHMIVEMHPDRHSTGWLNEWLDGVSDDYRAFRITYMPNRLGVRRVPRLSDATDPSGISAFNLLLSRRDRLSLV